MASKSSPVFGVVMARGGSQRIPRKNLQPFCGLPLLEWTLLQVRQANLIDAVYLVSDDMEIHELGARYGARPIWQTHEECEAGVNGGNIAMTRFLQRLVADGLEDSAYCVMMPTSPLRPPGMLDGAITMYFEKALPVQQLGLGCFAPIARPGFCYEVNPGRLMHLSNACAPGFLHYSMLAGICSTRASLLPYDGELTVERGLELVGLHIPSLTPPQYFYPVEQWQCHDIDNWYEFWLAETAMEKMILKGRGKEVYAAG